MIQQDIDRIEELCRDLESHRNNPENILIHSEGNFEILITVFKIVEYLLHSR